ncbi:hypothetical protein [Pseudomonas viridiflava]|uniref:hypothetical protein n=2 Tax=Pseudomonas viridiflava TaxID=33069 RepID=UPI001F14CF7B|nr:hypothetical protein [Pseudomonas viridiflava]
MMSLKVVKRLKGLFRSESSPRDDVPIIYPYADYVVEGRTNTSKFCYLYMNLSRLDFPADFIESFAALFNPTIIVHEGGYFIEENFTYSKYEDSLERQVPLQKIPYWINMVEITSLLGDIGYDEAAELGAVIRDCWGAKLNRLFPDSGFEALLCLEDDLDEVWVTLCKA